MPHAEGNGTPDRGLGQAFKSRWSRHGVLPRSSRGHLLTPLFERQEEAQGQELRGQGGSRGGLRRTRAAGHEPRQAHPARDRGPDSSCQGAGNRGLELSPGGKTVSESVYARLDVRPVINGMGTYTLLGGSIISPQVSGPRYACAALWPGSPDFRLASPDRPAIWTNRRPGRPGTCRRLP